MTFMFIAKYLSAVEVLMLAGTRHVTLAVIDACWVWHSSTSQGWVSFWSNSHLGLNNNGKPFLEMSVNVHSYGPCIFFAWSSFTKITAAQAHCQVVSAERLSEARFANIWWNSPNFSYTLNFTATAVNICWSVLWKKYLAKNLAIKLGNHSNYSPSG